MGRLLEVQLIEFPTSAALTHVFGIGSVLGTYFAAQVGSGLLLSFHYVPGDTSAFASVMNVIVEASKGSMLYIVHSVGAGTVFALLYCHVGKSMLVRSYSSYALLTGTILLVLIVASSFLGYVLVW